MRRIKDVFDKYTFSVLTGFWAMAFLVAGFLVEPTGEIHPSVLTACGEMFGFVAAVTGLEKYKDVSRMKYLKEKEEEGE